MNWNNLSPTSAATNLPLREAACEALKSAGQDALPHLYPAKSSRDTEVRLRACDLVALLEKPGQIGDLQAQGGIIALDLSRDGERIIAGGPDKTVHLWNRKEPVVNLQGHASEIWCVAFSPDGRTAASGGKEGVLFLWDLAEAKEIRRFEPAPAPIHGVVFSRDGKQLFSCGFDACVRSWDVATGKELQRFVGHQSDVFCLALSQDGKRLLSGGGYQDPTLRLWDVASGKEIRQFTGHKERIMAVLFGPDKKIYSGSVDKTVRLWNEDTSQPVKTFPEASAAIYGLSLSPDNRFLISSHADNSVWLWDAASGLPWRRIPRPHRRCLRGQILSGQPPRPFRRSRQIAAVLGIAWRGRQIADSRQRFSIFLRPSRLLPARIR